MFNMKTTNRHGPDWGITQKNKLRRYTRVSMLITKFFKIRPKEATMREKSIISLFIVALLIVTVSTALAGPWKGWRGSGEWGPGTPYNRMYNPATVETVRGEVTDIQAVIPYKGMYSGVQVILKTDKETVPVHLGPSWYIERLDVKIVKGDKIEVKGSRVTFAGKPTIIAGELKKGDLTLILRDASGIPVWAGWRR
jgi:hypothetical protein